MAVTDPKSLGVERNGEPMGLVEDTGITMPVQPMYGNGGNGFGGDGWWIILLLIFACGGWGMGGMGGMAGGMGLYPWMNQAMMTQGGFDQAATAASLAGIQTSLTTGFSNAEVAACNRAMSDMQTQYTNQIATMNQDFAAQTALNAQLNQMAANQASCCCENRLGLANLGADIAREACADRQAVTDALRDVIASNTANTQTLLTALGNGFQAVKEQNFIDKIDAKNERIAALENQLTMAQLSASQNAQTAALIANNEAQTTALEQYLAPVPRPAYMVQNPNCCGAYNYSGCGCGCAA